MSAHVLRFRVGRTWLGWPAESVLQVVRFSPATPLPRAPSHLAGLVSVDSRVLTAIDLAPVFDLPTDPAVPTRLVIVDLDGEPAALIAHEVRAVAAPEPAEEASELRGNEALRKASVGPGRLAGELLWILDSDRVTALLRERG